MKRVHKHEKGIEKEMKRKWVIKTVQNNVPSLQNDKEYSTKDVSKNRSTDKIMNQRKSKVCSKCGKSLPSFATLKIHMEHHKDKRESKWLCRLCPKRFYTRENLNVHMRIHTGERPYKCRFCEMKFRYRYVFTKHLKINHSNEEGVEKELKRKWFTKSEAVLPINNDDSSNNLASNQIESSVESQTVAKFVDETEFDDMPDLDDYSQDINNDMHVSRNEDYLTETEDTVEELDQYDNGDIFAKDMDTM